MPIWSKTQNLLCTFMESHGQVTQVVGLQRVGLTRSTDIGAHNQLTVQIQDNIYC